MREKRSALIQGKITPTLKDHVQKYADKHDLSESDVVQKALKFFLSRTTRNYIGTCEICCSDAETASGTAAG